MIGTVSPIRYVTSGLFTLALVCLVLWNTAVSTRGVNPFSSATWVLGCGVLVAVLAAGVSEVVAAPAHRRAALAVGAGACSLALAFACGVVYSLGVTLHVTDVLADYSREITQPATVCAVGVVALLVRAALVRPPAPSPDTA